jgi:O-succinylbenzoate synthase
MMQFDIHKHVLNFKIPGGTSRGVLTSKDTYIVRLFEVDRLVAIAEFNRFEGLSIDPLSSYLERLRKSVEQWLGLLDSIANLNDPIIIDLLQENSDYPSIQFGLEQLTLSYLSNTSPFHLFDSPFSRGESSISINGLIWMGDANFMKAQIEPLLEKGFKCLKMKIGAINFDEEYRLLKSIRDRFNNQELTLRVDANGAFDAESVLSILDKLSVLEVHSIEQPIKSGQWQEMARVVEESPIAIALDEELIGLKTLESRTNCIHTIQPDYLIFKPALIGGYGAIEQYRRIHDQFWITSALESNIGLNAIAQYTATLNPTLEQGLGTGSLYTNNFDSPLLVANGALSYQNELPWKIQL